MNPEWIGLAVASMGALAAVAAVAIAWWALRASNRSARAAEASAVSAQASVDEARRVRLIAERSDFIARTPGLALERDRDNRVGVTMPVQVWVTPQSDVDDLVIELLVDPARPQLNAASWISTQSPPTEQGSGGPIALGPTAAGTRALFWVGPNGGWDGRLIRIRCAVVVGSETWPAQILEVQSQARPPRSSRASIFG